ncbi:MAG: FtsQ-type POTRA domain-containing protein [Leptolyngbyaceae bacterium]|nr:FtsQ-type POTRA domain-containing protein [Leptolyngbyaceae bacterium]
MSNLDRISPKAWHQRRRYLRHQRRMGLLQGIWRFLLIAGLAGGAGWLMGRPGWVVQDANAIQVEGTVLLSPEVVRSHLPIQYPQSLFEIPTESLEQHLKSFDPIADATIHRWLFPPRLIVYIQEHRPVALLIGNSYTQNDVPIYGDNLAPVAPPELMTVTGFIDAKGTWLPPASYEDMQEGLGELPRLRVIGMRKDQREQWAILYQQLQQSPVDISEVDWRQIDNLILKTEIGISHHGPYDPNTFVAHLQLIDQMRESSQSIDLGQVQYFDFRSLDTPLIQYYPGYQDGPMPASP